ncbi:MAG: hypothetical protein M1831_006247 [Alyxoria varia]|nr:MAG: hypothetical protein M1831_006247 [Alyxoria varia]
MVVDGWFSLGPQDRNDRSFSISHLISTFKSNNEPRIHVDTAHRDGSTEATIWGKFNFALSVPDLTVYDEIWLFGYNGANQADPNNQNNKGPINDHELLAISRFMQQGGGVLASGDHEGLGCFMCGRIPRVRTMRKWFALGDDSPYRKLALPDSAPRNWPVNGSTRADTLQKDTEGIYNFTNQSDDIPQPLQLVKNVPGTDGLHPVFNLGNGKVLESFPDHFHEGEVLGFGGVDRPSSIPWALDDTLVFGGERFVEYPKPAAAGEERPLPQIIAMGHCIGGHATNVEGDKLCDSGFEPDLKPTEEKHINTLATYDGHAVNVGRVLTDSSFHHFTDLNVIGDPCAAGAKTNGLSSGFLNDLNQFYINTVKWLAKNK